MVTEKEIREILANGGGGGGSIKWKVFEMPTSNDGFIMGDDGNAFMFTEGVPIGAYPICDGTQYRYNEGSCKMQIQAYKPYDTNKLRYYFYAQYYNGNNASFIDVNKLTGSAIKFVVFYVPIEDFWNGVEE